MGCTGCFPALLSESPKKQPGSASHSSANSSSNIEGLAHGSFTQIRLVAKIVGSALMALLSNFYVALPYPFAFPAVGFAAQAAAMMICSVFALLLALGTPKPQQTKTL